MSRSGPGAEGQGDLPQKGPASSPAEGELGMACKGHSRQLCTPLGNGAGQEGGEAGGGGAGWADGARAEEVFSEEGGDCPLSPLASGSQLAQLLR